VPVSVSWNTHGLAAAAAAACATVAEVPPLHACGMAFVLTFSRIIQKHRADSLLEGAPCLDYEH
jgi:hypothetical protein